MITQIDEGKFKLDCDLCNNTRTLVGPEDADIREAEEIVPQLEWHIGLFGDEHICPHCNEGLGQ